MDGLRIMPGYLDRAGAVGDAGGDAGRVRAAPLYTPRMPKTGKPMSVRMTNCGPLGWVTDAERGYRYQADPPGDRRSRGRRSRRCCSTRGASFGLRARARSMPDQRLRTGREDGAAPGSRRAGFRRAGRVAVARRHLPVPRRWNQARRSDASVRLASGDAVVLGGEARLAFHGVDRILPGTSTLLPEGGRINLTMRRVTRP